MCDVCEIQARKLLYAQVTEIQLSSLQALEAVVRLEGNNQLRNGLGNLSYEIANDYLVEEFTIDKGEHRTVISISLAPKAMLKGKERKNYEATQQAKLAKAMLKGSREGKEVGVFASWEGEEE